MDLEVEESLIDNVQNGVWVVELALMPRNHYEIYLRNIESRHAPVKWKEKIKITNSGCMAIVDTAHCSDLFLPDYGVGITQDQREICREKLYKAAGDNHLRSSYTK